MTNETPESNRSDSQLPVYQARELAGEDGRAAICLDEKLYILRITRSGKLILTK